ncbi:MAG: Stk1 family PASTA domain-containing Ser/Thr kinase [Lachnospiraceae bacterium]|nr:Stk1 family PASTA domain-containing Ser/Thr kinase [Lachnospiraceae bacterium]
MVKIGMMIGDRYEILEKIGTGGMSDVYKAKDHKLNRNVAVKVLKQEFSENANFVSKFRIEAQAAAGLAHPNIVNVYDVGEDDGVYYIVMELVEGITLKKYIEKKARLSYKEAVSIAIQVSMGIESAHNNHIIHRDIKPQNIIISKEGKVKVTDFGIAKAATSNTITSNVMGSVHYTSPEQARGGFSDEKSDIYSLGITMFEMLTGRVPFNGDTTVAIAIKHIQEELPSPREYVDDIPHSVEQIVIKCCQKSPDRRYQNMSELISDLKQSLINPEGDFVVSVDPDIEGGTRVIADADMDKLKRHSEYMGDKDYVDYDSSVRTGSINLEYDDEYGDEEDEEETKFDKIATFLTIAFGIAILVIIFVFIYKFTDGFGRHAKDQEEEVATEEVIEDTEYVEMPAYKNLKVELARTQIESKGLKVELIYEESSDVDAGIVISCDVAQGTKIPVGTTVKLTVSAGISAVEVPDVVGFDSHTAELNLKAAGFNVVVKEENSDEVDVNNVISQSPAANSKAPKDSEIVLYVSIGVADVRVPAIVGLDQISAYEELNEAGLKIGTVTEVYSNDQPEDKVCYQSIASGSEVKKGTSIDINISKGPEPVAVETPKKYKCNLSIQAPNVTDDGSVASSYTAGTNVSLKLVDTAGNVLFETKSSTFPQSCNYSGLSASSGTLTMEYEVEKAGEPYDDPETGEKVVPPSTTETVTIKRNIQFTEE